MSSSPDPDHFIPGGHSEDAVALFKESVSDGPNRVETPIVNGPDLQPKEWNVNRSARPL
jgi:hypothetical protein